MPEQPDRGLKDTAERALTGKINLESASILLIDDSWGIDILTRVFVGFGARQLHKAESLDAASTILEKFPIDLIVTEILVGDSDIYRFIRELRLNEANARNRFTPVILLSAHTASSRIAEARDCGANFFVAKPISPKVMMERVMWVAGAKRQYLVTDTYAGPDRRFRPGDLPKGRVGRRRTDPRPGIEKVEQIA